MGIQSGEGPGFFTSRLERAVGWARKYSIFVYPFVTACCGIMTLTDLVQAYPASRRGSRMFCS